MHDVKTIITLGPATRRKEDLLKLKDLGVDFVRVNMSHSSLDDLEYFIKLAQETGLDFILDTEGSQVRTGRFKSGQISLKENERVKIYAHDDTKEENSISLKPSSIVGQLREGDVIHIDFDNVNLSVADTSTIADGYVVGHVLSSGIIGTNKAVVIDSGTHKQKVLPPLSKLDYKSIELGLAAGIKHIAASFVRSKQAVEVVRKATKGKMKVISKIECQDALDNLDEIIESSDFILIDRGDMSKEVPIEKIPIIQKIIINKAEAKGVDVYVATNLLESMIQSRRPTRAEVNDVINTILDGASGLTLAAETAIGKNPIASVNMINKLIAQANLLGSLTDKKTQATVAVEGLDKTNFLANASLGTLLVLPHGGKLVNRVLVQKPGKEYLKSLQSIVLDENLQMDIEQIAIGTFSPLVGFMNKADLQCVLDDMRLKNGLVWTIPILLDVSREKANGIKVGNDVCLTDKYGDPMAILHVEEKYEFDKQEINQKLYGTTSEEHPGVRWVNNMKPVFVAGPIDLIKQRISDDKRHELTPRQTRKLFSEKGWSKIVAFHTRNVIHKGHEFIQLSAFNNNFCDGLFIHPVVGKKKPGDYNAKYITKTYERMMSGIYPQGKVILATLATFSRYAGPREAVFTALCRQNFGCSHFIVGRDHTGVGDFYHPKASHEIFNKIEDIDIIPVKFDKVFYSKELGRYIHEPDAPDHPKDDRYHISGTEARKILEGGELPPKWFMRPEIAQIIIDSLKAGEKVFVPSLDKKTTISNAPGQVLWMTGLSGSGKSTLAEALKKYLENKMHKVEILDGDTVRRKINRHLGFSREDIRENNRLIAELAKKQANEFDFVLVPVISPYSDDRIQNRAIVGDNYHEVHIDCSIDECIARDPKGLYKKAQTGEIDNMIGLSKKMPYEAPENPELRIATHELDHKQSLGLIIDYLDDKLI